MKFCSKCGHEIFDQAVVCVHCGCSIDQPIQATSNATDSVAPTPTKEKKNSTTFHVFNFIFTLATAVSLFFLFMSLVSAYISVYVSSTAVDVDVNVYFYLQEAFASSPAHSHSGWGSFYPDEFCTVMSMIFSLIACASGITSFVLSLTNHETIDKKLSAISRFVVGILLATLSALFIGAVFF